MINDVQDDLVCEDGKVYGDDEVLQDGMVLQDDEGGKGGMDDEVCRPVCKDGKVCKVCKDVVVQIHYDSTSDGIDDVADAAIF